MNDPVVLVTVAALAGYHQFGLVDGGPFAGVDEDEFVRTLASLVAPTEPRPAIVARMSLEEACTVSRKKNFFFFFFFKKKKKKKKKAQLTRRDRPPSKASLHR